MLIVTAGNHKYKGWLRKFKANTDARGYKCVIYDLGGLGFGEKHEVNDESFQKFGFYNKVLPTWKTRALHKPSIVRRALEHNDFTIYVDADTSIVGSLDEVPGDYDVGITVRRPGELQLEPLPLHRTIMGCINAGVMFFNNTQATRDFVERWANKTMEVQNDQAALNELVNPRKKTLKADEKLTVHDVRFKTFTSMIYNFYYFPDQPPANVKIMHYKNNLWKLLHL